MDHHVPVLGGLRFTFLDYVNILMGFGLLSYAGFTLSDGVTAGTMVLGGFTGLVGIGVITLTLFLGRHKLRHDRWFENVSEQLMLAEPEGESEERSNRQK